MEVAKIAPADDIYRQALTTLENNIHQLNILAEQARADIAIADSSGQFPDYNTVPYCDYLFTIMEESMKELMPPKLITVVLNQSKYKYSKTTVLVRKIVLYLERKKRIVGLTRAENTELSQYSDIYYRMERRDPKRKLSKLGDFNK